MGGSIHIHGTGSSIVDTVFVCRITGRTRRSHIGQTPGKLIELVRAELAKLRVAGMKPSAGDIRCIVYGHLTRLAIWGLRKDWEPSAPTPKRLDRFHAAVIRLGDAQAIIDNLVQMPHALPVTITPAPTSVQDVHDAVSI
jgi:hypothetical protein